MYDKINGVMNMNCSKDINFKYKLPDVISKFLEDSIMKEISIGCSDSQVIYISKKVENYYLKMSKKNQLLNEYQKLTWLKEKLPIPDVITFIQENETDYLITSEVKGDMLCSKYYQDNPLKGIQVLKAAFDKIKKVNITNCPFNNTNNIKISLIKKRIENNLVDERNLSDKAKEKFQNLKNMMAYLEENKPKEELMFSFGDISLPNVIANKERLIGFIDLGECGIADKWLDLAICEKSIIRNYGIEYVDMFYEALGIEREADKVEYYLFMLELLP